LPTAVSALLSLVVAAGVTWGVSRFLVRRAARSGAGGVPRTGGIAVVLGFSCGVVLTLLVLQYEGSLLHATRYHWALWILAGAGLVLCGLVDDVRGLGPGTKFLVQTAAALTVYAAGFRIESVELPVLETLHLGWIGLPATVLWIVGVTNAINLIDGLDGLAPGIGVMACLTVAAIAGLQGIFPVIVIALSLAGALLGFLPLNLAPARIFLGDSGSQFLGFTLAVISIRGLDKSVTAVAILVPLLILGLPIWDTLLVVSRRAWRIRSENELRPLARERITAWRGLFERDREHVHYNLVDLGLSTRRAVAVLYATCALLCVAALGLMFHRLASGALVVALAAAGEIAIVKLLAARRRTRPRREGAGERPC
jgi:UDP-GlcNAc:undecaprenyl-phosphate GlcNAc-1-phosphate transferase